MKKLVKGRGPWTYAGEEDTKCGDAVVEVVLVSMLDPLLLLLGELLVRLHGLVRVANVHDGGCNGVEDLGFGAQGFGV